MKRHSIHIGIDRYEDKGIQDLPFCTADARLLASFFTDVAEYESVSTLHNPTRVAVLDAVADETAQLGQGDLLVVTFSGHGFRMNGKSSLCAADTRMHFFLEGVDGVPIGLIRELARDSECDCALFIDACPAEGMGTRDIAVDCGSGEQSGRDLILEEIGNDAGAAFAIMSPEKAVESEALGHGCFTVALDRALRKAYDCGEQTIWDVCRHAEKELAAITKESGMAANPGICLSTSGHRLELW